MCFLKEPLLHSPRNFVDTSTGRSVSLILIVCVCVRVCRGGGGGGGGGGGVWALFRGAVKCTTLHLWAANLKPFPVAHICMAFTACCRCLSTVLKTDCQIINKECSEDERWQLINVQSEACNSQDATSWNTFFWVEFIRECVSDSEHGHHRCSHYLLQWRHNDHNDVSNHWRLDCLLNRWFRRRSEKTSKLRVT